MVTGYRGLGAIWGLEAGSRHVGQGPCKILALGLVTWLRVCACRRVGLDCSGSCGLRYGPVARVRRSSAWADGRLWSLVVQVLVLSVLPCATIGCSGSQSTPGWAGGAGGVPRSCLATFHNPRCLKELWWGVVKKTKTKPYGKLDN